MHRKGLTLSEEEKHRIKVKIQYDREFAKRRTKFYLIEGMIG